MVLKGITLYAVIKGTYKFITYIENSMPFFKFIIKQNFIWSAKWCKRRSSASIPPEQQ